MPSDPKSPDFPPQAWRFSSDPASEQGKGASFEILGSQASQASYAVFPEGITSWREIGAGDTIAVGSSITSDLKNLVDETVAKMWADAVAKTFAPPPPTTEKPDVLRQNMMSDIEVILTRVEAGIAEQHKRMDSLLERMAKSVA